MTHSRRRAALVAAAALLIGVGLAFAARASGVHLTRVVSSSMSPAIHRGDWVVLHDLSQDQRHTVRRRDIVLFRFPLGTTGRAVKRVVALGRDKVAISDRTVTINGRVIPISGAPSTEAARRRVEIVPEGEVFLLGDNASVSIDSRSLGPVPESELVGRVVFVIPKPTPLFWIGVAAVIGVIASGLFMAGREPRRSARDKLEAL